MELIHVAMSSAELVAAPAPIVVQHRDIEATERGHLLEEGDEVVVSDTDGEFHAAVVVAVDLGEEPAYRLSIGARLPMDLAAQRLADVELTPEEEGLHEIVDLLGELRRNQGFRQQP